MKIIVVTVLLTLLAAAAVSVGSIVGYKAVTSHSEPTPQPDRVIAVLAECQVLASGKTFDYTGSECQQGDRKLDQSTAVINSRLQITIRTSEGSTYEIDVPITTNVAVGDTWPK